MQTDEFDYLLPEELIAQSPAEPRESCRLLLLDKTSGAIGHDNFYNICTYLKPDDLLIVNDTKVMQARLIGKKPGSDTKAELLLLRRADVIELASDPQCQLWEALVKPGRRLKPGSSIDFGGLTAEVIDWAGPASKGQRLVRLLSQDYPSVEAALAALGTLPLPPYIKSYQGDSSLYQTVYARQENSAAAPTAGLHFSNELLAEAEAKGCKLAKLCLEIGLDTFRKVDEANIEDHQIHSEFYTLTEEVVEAVAQTRARGGRVIAVGTTVVRALESSALEDGMLKPIQRQQTQLYITPGFNYQVVDALITNFHTPRSTLLMLVAAFAGYDNMMEAYRQALAQRYRFLSFGDAMFIF